MISVVVPVYNEKDNLENLAQQISSSLQKTGQDWELILVDDGSKDDSFGHIRKLSDADKRIKGLRFSRNFGQYAAVRAGLDKAGGDAIIVMDADLQEPPSLIPKLIERWRSGDRAVYTTAVRRNESIFRRIPALLFHKIFWNNIDLGKEFSLREINNVSEMRLLDKSVADEFRALKERPRFIKGLFFWLGFRHSFVEYEKQKRAAGKSKYSLIRLVKLALDGFFSFSALPVKGIFYLGTLLTLIGVAGGACLLFGISPAGLPAGVLFLAVLILFIAGVQLFCMGILGEYMERIYDEVRQRPKYIIEEEFGFNPKN